MLRKTACALFLSVTNLFAGDAREDWAAVKALDAGPGVMPKTAAEVYAASLAHSDKQEKALRGFLAAHAGDTNAFEAMLRLARVLDLRAEMKAEPPSAEALAILEKASQLTTTVARQTEFEFALLTRRMRKWRSARPPVEERRAILLQTRQFESANPSDRRIPVLLVEIAALFDFEPATKEALLQRAKRMTKNPDLLAQISDDLKKIAFLGRALPLRFTALDGRRVDVTTWQGKVVAVVFFATWSAPSKTALTTLLREAETSGAEVAIVSLDGERAELENFLRAQNITAPVAWDGKGWDGPLMQALGINSVPTAWLLDPKGVLRSLDALEDPAGQIRRLQAGK